MSTPSTRSDVTTPAGRSDVTTPAGRSDVTAPAGRSDVTAPAGRSDVTAPLGCPDVNAPPGCSDVSASPGRADANASTVVPDARAKASTGDGPLLLATPMRVEAWLVSSAVRHAQVHRTGMGPAKAKRAAIALRELPGCGLLVIGFCGALDDSLAVGDVVVASRVDVAADEGHCEPGADCGAAEPIAAALRGAGLHARCAPIVCTTRIVTGARRTQLCEAGALAVDMESAWLAAAAGRRPFATVRVVLDTPDQELLRPRLAITGPRAGAVLRRAARAVDHLVETGAWNTLFAGS